MDVLVCLAVHAPRLVTRGELLDTVWPGHVAADELLTGAVSDLRRVLDDDSTDPRYIETVPKRGYRLIHCIGPAGASEHRIADARSADGVRRISKSRRVTWTVVGTTIIIAVVSAALFVVGMPGRRNMALPPARSIAVLPFVSLSSDPQQEWFADGLTEEILNSLARTPDLRVAARTSSFAYKGANQDIRSIAATLGVDHVLEGSVRRDAHTLRVTVQLVRASDGLHLWSEAYDSANDDMIRIQEDIATRIARALLTAMDPEALTLMVSTGTTSVPAFEAYLRGLSLDAQSVASGDHLGSLDVKATFERAIGFDPGFALVYRKLAEFWEAQLSPTNLDYGLTALTSAESLLRFEDSIDKAIEHERDPVRKLGHRAYKARVDMRYLQALRLNSEFLERRPNSHDAQVQQLILLDHLARHDEASVEVARYYERDGFNARVTSRSLQSMRDTGDSAAIRAFTLNAVERFADDSEVLYQAHRNLLWAGDVRAAAGLLPAILSSRAAEHRLYLVSLRQACAERRLEDAERLYASGTVRHSDRPGTVWLAHKIMGNEDAAVESLRPFDDARNLRPIAFFLVYGYFDPAPYPNLTAMLRAQGIPPRPVLEVPFRCNRR